MSLVVFPFKDEPASLVAANLATAARQDRVDEVWAIAADEKQLTAEMVAAAQDISTQASTPVRLILQERLGSFRPGKGDAMNTALRRAAGQGRDRVHFYDADISNFDGSWIEGAEIAADRGYGVVRHRFPRPSTDAMITWMITRPGLAIAFPGTLLPRINQPLGGEILVTRDSLEALAASTAVRERSDWGIDTLITYRTAILEGGLYEHHVGDGKRHALYGSLEELRLMIVECLDAVASIRGAAEPDPEAAHGTDDPTPTPPDLEGIVAYDVERSIGLLTRGWSEAELAIAAGLPAEIAAPVLRNRIQPSFSFMDEEAWFTTLSHLLIRFRLGEPAWESLAFRLWLIRVLSYTTGKALAGYQGAMDYLESTIAAYEKWSST